MSAERTMNTSIETRKKIAEEIYEAVSQSLHTLMNDPSIETHHSTIIELTNEQAIAQRAIESLGVKVA